MTLMHEQKCYIPTNSCVYLHVEEVEKLLYQFISQPIRPHFWGCSGTL